MSEPNLSRSAARWTSRVVALPEPNVDTDQIIPARFLKVTGKEGLGEALFADWRSDPAFVLNQPESAGAEVLVAGDNFGCGSSREHAPWALLAGGFRAVVSTSFADIFRGNALKNGLLPIAVPPWAHAELLRARAADPAAAVTVDLEACTLTLPGGREVPFPVDAFARRCLLQGVDELGYLMGFLDRIAAFEAVRDAEEAA